MLRKILLGLTLFTVLVSCKKVDPELTAEITFKLKTTISQVGKNDTAYVTIDGDSKGSIVKFIASDTAYVSILKEGDSYVVYKQNAVNSNNYITAGLISHGQLKSQDTLWLKATGTTTPISSKGDIAYVYSESSSSRASLYTFNPNTKIITNISTKNTYAPYAPSWTPDKKGIMVNDSYYGGFYIYTLNGSYLSSNSSYNISSSYTNNRFSLDGKAIYGYSTSGGCYIKDYNTKANIILPISPSNSSVYGLAIGSISDNIAYATSSGGYYKLYHYKNGVTTLLETSYYSFTDVAVSPNGQYVAYVINTDKPNLKIYNRSNNSSFTIDSPYYSNSYVRSPSFNSSNDQLMYSAQYGNNSGTYYTESVIIYGIKTGNYSTIIAGQQPSR